MSSKFLKRDSVQRVVAALITGYVRIVYLLTRWTRVNLERLDERAEAGKPMIVCFWHGRMILMPNFWRYRMQLHLLGSRHADARLIYRTVQRFGVQTIIGSSDYGGTRALREMVRAIRAGGSICMTPDGPRGPRMRANLGIIALAKMSGVPIYPVSYSTSRGKILGTWDRFFIPYPFGRGVIVIGEPVEVPDDADHDMLEALRLELETRLNAATAEADRLCGRATVQPAAPDEKPAVKIKAPA
jgi:lysophospholipid acyltransferase (LPLAT)-like uncharacterized protein